jgi:hypothetical protein
MTSKNIRTDSLDFDEIKQNIKNFLRGQSKFTDYDFEGSALSILIDVLAYNTHYNSLYTNLAVNEMFLDSANKYSSVVSLAKSLGYNAKSITSARAKINLTITTNTFSTNTLVLPAGTVFRGKVGDVEYDFVVESDVSSSGFLTADNINGVYRFFDVSLVEGYRLTKQYVATATGFDFAIPNRLADLSSLQVSVQDNASSSIYTGFGFAADTLSVQGDTPVYFIKQRDDLYYEIFFGNDVIGKAVNPGNVVHLSYLVSSGSAANGANNFVYSRGLNLPSLTSTVVELVSAAYGGAEEEDIDSVRFNAPRAYASQNRAVTAEDYKNILYTNYPSIETIATWGGQENYPPVYGKVYISAKPYGASSFTAAEKESIINFIKRTKSVVSVTPVFVDPEFLRIELTSTVNFNRNAARRSVGEIQSLVAASLVQYGNSLGKFGSNFRYSKVCALIDGADDSITSNETSVKIRHTISPLYNKNARYTVPFDNPIFDNPLGGAFFSTRFYIPTIEDRCYLSDDGAGNIDLYSETIEGTPSRIRTVGKIEYVSGLIDVYELTISGLHDTLFEFVVIPAKNDIFPTRKYIIQMPEELLNISMQVDNT